MKKSKIAAVVVTYNRKDLLQECLNSLLKQTRKPDSIIIIDNASTDGTGEMLKQKYLKNPIFDYINLEKNTGGAGGFHYGIKRGYEKGFDWVWCMDDDTVPYPKSLQSLLSSPVAQRKDVGFLSSVVKWKDKKTHPMNKPIISDIDWLDFLESNALSIISSSFVSIAFPLNTIRSIGFPKKEMFIWGDDEEYTLRAVSSNKKGFLILNSFVEHKTINNSGLDFRKLNDNDRWKIKYFFKNKLYTTALYPISKKRVIINYFFVFEKLAQLLIHLKLTMFILGLLYSVNGWTKGNVHFLLRVIKKKINFT